jgi:hypothetical protein
MRVYLDIMMPDHLVVGDPNGRMWAVPDSPAGWVQRVAYSIPPGPERDRRLQEVPSCLADSVWLPEIASELA